MATMTITITRRTRSLGYGVTSHVRRDGSGIETPYRQSVGLTPRTLLITRRCAIRATGGCPDGGAGCRYREAVFVGGARVVFDEHQDMSALLWELAELRDGDVDAITVTVEAP